MACLFHLVSPFVQKPSREEEGSFLRRLEDADKTTKRRGRSISILPWPRSSWASMQSVRNTPAPSRAGPRCGFCLKPASQALPRENEKVCQRILTPRNLTALALEGARPVALPRTKKVGSKTTPILTSQIEMTSNSEMSALLLKTSLHPITRPIYKATGGPQSKKGLVKSTPEVPNSV